MPKPVCKVIPDAATRYVRVAELWADVKVEEAAICEAMLVAKERRKTREELLAKIGAIIEDGQLALPFEDAEN